MAKSSFYEANDGVYDEVENVAEIAEQVATDAAEASSSAASAAASAAAAAAGLSGEYLVKTAHVSLTAERVVTDGAAAGKVNWDWSVAGQVKGALYASAANKIIYSTGSTAWAETSVTAEARGVLGSTNITVNGANTGFGVATPLAPVHMRVATNQNLYTRASYRTASGVTLQSLNDAGNASVPIDICADAAQLSLFGTPINFWSGAVPVQWGTIDLNGKWGIGAGFGTPTARLEVNNATAGLSALYAHGVAAQIVVDYNGGGSNFYDAAVHYFRTAGYVSQCAIQAGALTVQGGGSAGFNVVGATNDSGVSWQFGNGGSGTAVPGVGYFWNSVGSFVGRIQQTGLWTFGGYTAATNRVAVEGGIQLRSSTTYVDATSGKGLEMSYNGTADRAHVNSFDRGAVVYKDLWINAATLSLNNASTGPIVLGGRLDLKSYTVATVPAAASGGLLFVTDLNTTTARTNISGHGGGSNKCVCWSDGTNWYVLA